MKPPRPSGMTKGTLVADEQMLPITDIILRDGKVTFVSILDAASRMHLHDGQELRIHGDDGSVIGSVRWRIPSTKVSLGEHLTVFFSVSLIRIEYAKEKL